MKRKHSLLSKNSEYSWEGRYKPATVIQHNESYNIIYVKYYGSLEAKTIYSARGKTVIRNLSRIIKHKALSNTDTLTGEDGGTPAPPTMRMYIC